jgi:hypothetical protein
MVDYPPTCLRGIPNKEPQYFSTTGDITGYIFRPHSEQKPNKAGWYELSINWEDDDTVEKFTLQTLRDNGSIKYKGGVARVGRNRIERLGKIEQFNGYIGYERSPLPDNPFHGNVLLHQDKVKQAPKARRNAFYGRLADIVIDVIPPIES